MFKLTRLLGSTEGNPTMVLLQGEKNVIMQIDRSILFCGRSQ